MNGNILIENNNNTWIQTLSFDKTECTVICKIFDSFVDFLLIWHLNVSLIKIQTVQAF